MTQTRREYLQALYDQVPLDVAQREITTKVITIMTDEEVEDAIPELEELLKTVRETANEIDKAFGR